MNARQADGSPERTPLIAVVDDEPSICRALGRLLRAAGFESRQFCKGTEFLEACRHEPPDCVVLDMHMPDMSGLQVQQRLNDSGLFLPMVLITADDESSFCRRVVEEGAVALLRKPVDGPDLIEKVEGALARARTVHAINARITSFVG